MHATRLEQEDRHDILSTLSQSKWLRWRWWFKALLRYERTTFLLEEELIATKDDLDKVRRDRDRLHRHFVSDRAERIRLEQAVIAADMFMRYDTVKMYQQLQKELDSIARFHPQSALAEFRSKEKARSMQ